MIRYTQLFGEVVMEATQKSWTKTTLLMLVGWEHCWSVYYRVSQGVEVPCVLSSWWN